MMYLPHQRHSSIMRDRESLNQKEPWPFSFALRPFCSAKPAVVGRYLHLDEQFTPDRPNAVWCSDITYIWTTDGFVYLTSIMDLFSRKIIAWTLSQTLEVSSVIHTINKAKARRNTKLPLIIHSDRGSQYVSQAYREATAKMQRSYSKKAFPWDNACIESFHALIKREWLNRFKIRDYQQAYRLIFEYIEAFYNTKRIHSHCDYMSPDDFEKLYEQTQTNELLLVS